MNFLIDNNVSLRIVAHLQTFGHQAEHVAERGYGDASDKEIADLAAAEGRIVITADSDFPTMLALSGAFAPSIIYLTGNYPTDPARLAVLINNQLGQIGEDLLSGAVAAIDGKRIRIRKLPISKE